MRSLLRTKRLVWALAVALVTVIVTFTYFSSRRYVAAVESVQHTLEVSSAIDRMLAAIMEQETDQRGHLLTGEEVMLARYRFARANVAQQVERLRLLTADNPVQRRALEELEKAAEEKHRFMDQMIELVRAGKSDAALEAVRSGRGRHLMNAIRECTERMGKEERRLLTVRSDFAARTQGYALGAITIGALVTALMLVASFVALHRDAEELRKTAEELAESEERFRVLADSASDIVRVYELDGTVWYQSPSMERLLGFTLDEINAMPTSALLHPDDLDEARALFMKLTKAEVDGGMLVHRMICKDGTYRWFETNFVLLHGSPPRVQTTARDVTQRRRDTEALALRADEMRTLSLRDVLTGLYNRRGFFELGEQLERVAVREKRSLAVVFVDLDGLKPINDQFGHEAGDRAINEAAALLRSVCRSADVAVRLGGDEFAVIAMDLDATSFGSFRARIELALAARNMRGDLPFELSFSMGAAFRPTDREEPLETLLARADAAMYSEKRAHRAERGLRMSLAPAARPRPSIQILSMRPNVSQRPR
jgi:diguanylate cyclase (GGDEF)-like protein/PAS domain S-box-containing protein